MPTITRKLVSRYIEGAQPFAESKTERLAIQLAAELNTPSPKRRSAHNPRQENPKTESKAEEKVRSWQELIWNEIHAVLCTSSSRYRKQVATLKKNTDLMIWTIAAYIAGKIGIGRGRSCARRVSTSSGFIDGSFRILQAIRSRNAVGSGDPTWQKGTDVRRAES